MLFGKVLNKVKKIEFFTEYPELLEYQPRSATRFIPDWFKSMAASHDVQPNQRFPFGIDKKLALSNINATVKRCPGILSYLSEGYIIPLWSDYVVQSRGEQLFAFGSNAAGQIGMHSKDMHFDKMPRPEGFHKDALKFVNPWKVITPPGWSILLCEPFYHFNDNYQILPGVIDSDSYHHIHVNTLFKASGKDVKLNMGTPFVLAIPFPRDSINELEVRVSTEKDKERLKNLRFRMDRFSGKNRAIKSIDDE